MFPFVTPSSLVPGQAQPEFIYRDNDYFACKPQNPRIYFAS
jgi:hypothetical protein